MSSKDIAIKVENISKVYRIGSKEELHDSFGGALVDLIKSPLKISNLDAMIIQPVIHPTSSGP